VGTPLSEYGDLVSEIADGLYVSGLLSDFPTEVDAVLCLCMPSEMNRARAHGYPDPLSCGGLREYAWRPIPDDPREVPSLDWLDVTADLVAGWRRAGRTVLCHCAAGISRSPTVACAYLMKQNDWAADEAIARAKVARPVMDPNFGFRDLLARYYDAARKRIVTLRTKIRHPDTARPKRT
jgi:hypothetical protein